MKQYDFLDFGASKGASLEYAKKHLFGKKGLGIDLDPVRVELMKKSGYDCMVGDLTDLKLPAKCVKFVKMSHILEHMPDLDGVQKAISSAKNSATDFLVITGPYFDEDKYLKSLGLKLHWSDYPEHTCHLTVKQLIKILQSLKLSNYELYLRYPITDSSSEHIHPLSSPSGSHQYDSQKHPAKKQVKFNRTIWTDFVCYVRLKPEIHNWDQITQAYNHQIPYVFAKNGEIYEWQQEIVDKFVQQDFINRELEKKVQDTKQQHQQIVDRVAKLNKQLSNMQSSKAWRVVGRLQKTSAIIRRPATRLKKSRSI